VIPSLRKWAFFLVTAAAVAIIGCGGSSHSSSSSVSSTTGTVSQPVAATVTLPTTYGLVYVGFLTGAARASGDLYLNVENVILNDTFDGINAQRQNATSPIVMQLNNYNFQMATIDVQLSGINSLLFNYATIVPYSFAVQQPNGYVGLNIGDSGVLPVLQQNEPNNMTSNQMLAPLYGAVQIQPSTRLRVFPGRDSVLPVFFDQTMFAIDGSGDSVGLVPDPNATFQSSGIGQTLFQDTNEPQNSVDPTTSGKIAGYLSDMVQISLANIPASHIPLASQTSLGTNHNYVATDFYLSGDRYAVGSSAVPSPTNTNPNFEELTLDVTQPITGIVGQPGSVLSTQFQFGGFPGTYDLLQQNPSLFSTSEITSLFGRWRPISSVLNLTQTSFDLIVFPNSNESYTYSNPGDVIAIVHSGNTVKDLYIGYAWYTGGPSGQVAGARVYPLRSFVTASTANEVDFVLSNFAGNGVLNEPAVRNGTYQITSSTIPTGFPTSKTGTFVVFRE
jgi:hypothetical protein